MHLININLGGITTMGFLSALNLGGNSYKLKPGNIYECQTQEQWNALTKEQQDEYDYVITTDDEEEQDLTNAYLTSDSAVSTINVNDYFPVQKTDGTKKKLLWSTIMNKIKSTLGTAAQKDSTDEVTESSTDLVESGAVYSEVNTLKQALTTVVEQTKPTSTANIGKGNYFFLDGSLVKAKVIIHSGDTFTENTNFETPSNGGLNDIVSSFFHNEQFIVAGQGSKNITFGGGANAFLICNGASSLCGLFIVGSDTSGNVSTVKLSNSDSGASIGLNSSSPYVVTITNNASGSLRCSLILLAGSITI